MKLYCYDDNDKKIETEKFSELAKRRGMFIEGSGGEYDDDDFLTACQFESKDAEKYMKYSAMVEFLRNYFCCEKVADAYVTVFMSDAYYSYRKKGFLIVNNDRIEKFITWDYAEGLFDGVNYCHNQEAEYKAK